MGSNISQWVHFPCHPACSPALVVCTEEVQVIWKCLIMQEGGDKERYALESLTLNAVYHLREGTIPKAKQGRWLGVKLCSKEPVMEPGHCIVFWAPGLHLPGSCMPALRWNHWLITPGCLEASSLPPAVWFSGALLVVEDQCCKCICVCMCVISNLLQTSIHKIQSKWITRKITFYKRHIKHKSWNILSEDSAAVKLHFQKDQGNPNCSKFLSSYSQCSSLSHCCWRRVSRLVPAYRGHFEKLAQRSPWRRLAVHVWVQVLLPRPGGAPTAISLHVECLGMEQCQSLAVVHQRSALEARSLPQFRAGFPGSQNSARNPDWCALTQRGPCQPSPSRLPFFCLDAWSLAGSQDNVSVSYCCCN